ncbi:short-chain dehydrogenase [Planctomycetaceae bacterium SCGC AG-212-F19]|nr:short-chain dehydrogenase [Planctomycetaceae bacterium SCGC AG-212-F19]
MSAAKGTVLITGASGGIGYALARLFARDGYPLLLAARSEDKLRLIAEELRAPHGVAVTPCAIDLAEPKAAQQLFEVTERQDQPVEILVNNAGFGSYGPFVTTDLETTLQILQLNIVALTELTRLVVPRLLERGRGKVLNVASTAAFQPGPLMAVYYASKAYVLHFSEALADELRQTPVTVTALCPGPTATGFEERAGLGSSKLFTGRRVMDVETVAAAGYRGLMRGRRLVIPGMWNRLLVFGNRLTPRRVVTAIVRRMQERRDA